MSEEAPQTWEENEAAWQEAVFIIKVGQANIEALIRYRDHGIPTGGFLNAVLENDLINALARADHVNRGHLPEIVTYIAANLPWSSWGNPERVAAWTKSGGLNAEQG